MVNSVTLIGRVGQDPEIRNLPNGTVISKFSLATNRARKNPDGSYQDETEWHNVTTFGKTAENVRNYVHKGMLIYVDGRIHYNKYEDKDGVKRVFTEIVANQIKFLEKRESSQQQSYSQGGSQPQQNQPNDSFHDDHSGTEDDVPF